MDSEARIAAELAALEAAGNLRTLHRVRPDGLYLWHEGRRYLNLSSNDYLALSASPYSTLDLRRYAAEAWGAERLSPHLHGNPASRLMTADSEEYDILESELAALFPGRAALVLGCGYMLNSGLMPALADKSELILADKLVHASMIEGLTHGAAEFRRFPHNDLAALERQLQRAAGRGVWVLVESLYSMDGDGAPLRELAALKERYGFRLYVDEAHSFAVRGPQGKGLCAELGVEAAVDLLVCTFGKAVAGAGAAVICSPLVRRLLINRLRPLIFSTALPPVTLLWDAMVLREMRTESLQAQGYPGMGSLRAQLAAHVRRFTELTGLPASSQIIPLPCGSNERALAAAEAGRAAGLWLTAIRRPTVPAGSERIRLSLNAGLTDAHLQQLADLCRKLG
ncbi:MAG: aminotransferase class I/II-fold pyridoxal phosphate-dependent enzyme [Akkermansia sp.]